MNIDTRRLLVTGGLAIDHISNPYEGINFGTVKRLASDFHMHGNRSWDVYVNLPDEVQIAKNAEYGWDVITMTDHTVVSNSQGMGTLPTGLYNAHGKDVYVIRGVESENDRWAIILLNDDSNTNVAPINANTSNLQWLVQNTNATMYCVHPWRLPNEHWIGHFEQCPSDRLIGMEIGGMTSAERIPSMQIWDNVLTHFAPDRPIWGFVSSDLHTLRIDTPPLAWTLTELLATQKNKESINDCIMNGRSFCARRSSTNPSYTRLNPYVTDIIVDQRKKTIEVKVVDDTAGIYPPVEIQWTSCGEVVSNDWKIDLEKLKVQKYVRFTLTSRNSTNPLEDRVARLYSQPFMIHPREVYLPRAVLRTEYGLLHTGKKPDPPKIYKKYGLVFNGQGYIESGIGNVGSTTRVVIDTVMHTTTVSAIMFGVRDSISFSFWQNNGGSSLTEYKGHQVWIPRTGVPFNQRLLIDKDRASTVINGVQVGNQVGQGTFSTPTSIVIGSSSNAGVISASCFRGVVYSCQIYNPHTDLVRDFVAVPQGDTQYSATPAPSHCFWDKVSEQYFVNAGTGSLGIVEDEA